MFVKEIFKYLFCIRRIKHSVLCGVFYRLFFRRGKRKDLTGFFFCYNFGVEPDSQILKAVWLVVNLFKRRKK